MVIGTYKTPCRALFDLPTLTAALYSIRPYITNFRACLPGIHEEPRGRYVALHKRIVHDKCGLIDQAPGLDRILFKLIASLEGKEHGGIFLLGLGGPGLGIVPPASPEAETAAVRFSH